MRHLRSSNPFERVVFKGKKARAESASGQKRAASAKHRAPEGLTNEKIRESIEKDYRGNHSGFGEDKYGNYKNEVLKEYIRDRENNTDKKVAK